MIESLCKTIATVVCVLLTASAAQAQPQDNAAAEADDTERGVTLVQPPEVGDGVALRRGVHWDVNLEGGGGFGVAGRLRRQNYLGRMRAGVLLINEPYFLSIGPTGEVGGLAEYGVGLEADVVQLWQGFHMNVGGTFAKNNRLVFHAGLGLSLFGMEWQFRVPTDNDKGAVALFFTLRLPIGIMDFGIHQNGNLTRSAETKPHW